MKIMYHVDGTQIKEVEVVEMTSHWAYIKGKTAVGINTKIKKSRRNLRGGYFETLESARENVRLRLNKEIRELETRVKILKGQLDRVPGPPMPWKAPEKKAPAIRGTNHAYWIENRMAVDSAIHILNFGKTGPLTALALEGAKTMLKWDEDRINSKKNLNKPTTKAEIKRVFGLV